MRREKRKERGWARQGLVGEEGFKRAVQRQRILGQKLCVPSWGKVNVVVAGAVVAAAAVVNVAQALLLLL